jgi:hypothetical protein
MTSRVLSHTAGGVAIFTVVGCTVDWCQFGSSGVVSYDDDYDNDDDDDSGDDVVTVIPRKCDSR